MPEFEDQRGRREEKKQEREIVVEKGGRAAAVKRISPRLRVDESGSHPLFRRAEPTPPPRPPHRPSCSAAPMTSPEFNPSPASPGGTSPPVSSACD